MAMNHRLMRPRTVQQPAAPTGTPASLLLHFDGTNGSTVFTDSSVNALTVTANGDAQISTDQSKFGGSSGYFDGDGDWAEIAANAALELSGESSWTLEFFLYPLSKSGTRAIVGKGATGTVSECWSLEWSGEDLAFFASENGGTIDYVASGTVAVDQWTHIALVVNNGDLSMFVDGVLSGGKSGFSMSSTAGTPLVIGAGWYSPVDRGAECYIDDLRIVKGVAVYQSAFTPPAGPLSAYA